MRITRFLALGLLLTVAVAGCGQAPADDEVATVGGTPSAIAAAGRGGDPDDDDKNAGLKFSQCMRDQGLSWFPDPQPVGDGGMRLEVPKGADKAKVDAATEACKEFAPGGGDMKRADPQMLENARKMAQCMRENGVPNFPDPNPDGSIHIDSRKTGAGPGDPAFDKAEQACSKFRPDAGRTNRMADE